MVEINNSTNKTADTFTATTSLATTFDTNVAASGLEIAGTTISADGTDANISITMTPKGTGTVNPAALSVNSAFTFPVADGTSSYVLQTDGAGAVTWQPNSTAGTSVQIINAQTSALVTANVTIPTDDTIPQKTEGVEVLTATITPTSATNKLFIIFSASMGNTIGGQSSTIALFQDATTNSLSSIITSYNGVNNSSEHGVLTYYMTAGTTSATTFKIRVGPQVGSSSYINGNAAARIFGGVASTQLTIIEIKV